MTVADRRNTEVSGFTLFEGDSWRSDSDDKSSVMTNEDILLEMVERIHGAKSVGSSGNEADPDQPAVNDGGANDSSSLEDEDLEPTPTNEMMHDEDKQVPPRSTDQERQAVADADAEKEESSTSSQNEDDLESIHVDSETDGDDSIEIIRLPIASDENSLSISEHLNSFRGEHYNESRRDVVEEHSQEEELLSHERQQEEEFMETSWIPLQNSGREGMHYNQELHDNNGTNRPTRRQPATPREKKKQLTPAKKRRRFFLCLSLFLFCAGTAGAAYWFIFYFLDDLRQEKTIDENQYVASETKDEETIVVKPVDVPIIDTDAECASFTVVINTDSFGNETSWVLSYFLDSNDNLDHDDDVYYERRYQQLKQFTPIKRNRLRQHSGERRMQQPEGQELAIGSGGPYDYLSMSANNQTTTSQYTSSFCLTKGSYKFEIYDSNGDGFCCRYGQGSYSLQFDGGRVVHTSPFELQRVESTVFDVTDGDIVAALSSMTPSISMIPTLSHTPSITPLANTSSSIKSMTTASGPDLLANVSKSYGLVFDIQTNRNITSVRIVGMDLLVYVNDYVNYEVWTAKGELNMSKDVPLFSSFSLAANGTLLGSGVCGGCGFSSIPLDEFQDVYIDGAKTLQSFYVTLSSDSLVFNNGNVQMAQSSCDSFVVNLGSAVLAYSMETVDPTLDLSDNKAFLGVIHYESDFQDIPSTSHPTPSPYQFMNSTSSTSNTSMAPTFDNGTKPATSNSSMTFTPTYINNSTLNSAFSILPSHGPTSFNVENSTTIMDPGENNTVNAINLVLNATIAPTSVKLSNSTSAPLPSLPTSPGSFFNNKIKQDGDNQPD